MATQKIKRNMEIMRLRALGWELPEIGKKLGISKQRVFQIIETIQRDQKELRRLKRKKSFNFLWKQITKN